MSGWTYLILAIMLEVAGTTCLKLSHGLTKLLPSLLMFACYGLSFAVLSVVLKTLAISVAYAVWSGLGTALIASIGFVWFHEPVTALKLLSIGLIILGVMGLNLGGGGH